MLHVFWEESSIHHHLQEAISETANVLELRQKLPYTTPSGWRWCTKSLLRYMLSPPFRSQTRSVLQEGSLSGEIMQTTRTARDKSQENTAPPLLLDIPQNYPCALSDLYWLHPSAVQVSPGCAFSSTPAHANSEATRYTYTKHYRYIYIYIYIYIYLYVIIKITLIILMILIMMMMIMRLILTIIWRGYSNHYYYNICIHMYVLCIIIMIIIIIIIINIYIYIYTYIYIYYINIYKHIYIYIYI